MEQQIFEPCYLKNTVPVHKPITVLVSIDKTKGDVVIVADLKEGDTQPQNFYGVGGMKNFRDLIYQMQGMMKAW